jgi:hypothetical protein
VQIARVYLDSRFASTLGGSEPLADGFAKVISGQ